MGCGLCQDLLSIDLFVAEMYPYETIAMVGDGITDLEAVEITGGADIFIG